jgi:hypothetical protein
MLLNELRNDEIYPHFWSANATDGWEASFVDLSLIQKQIDAGVRADDIELEALLFGTLDRPLYSGWTWSQFTKVSEACGLKEISQVGSDGVTLGVRAVRGEWNLSAARRERVKQKIWEWRKGFRKKAKETVARARAVVGKRIPAGGVWLNLGAGEENYSGYIKVDLSGNQHVFDNIVTLKKISDASVDRIYCNHVLEHIPVALIPKMLERWRQVLKPGGVVLARAPDAKQAIRSLEREWREADEKEVLALGFPNYLEREAVREGILDSISCIQTIYGWSSSTPHAWDLSNQHKSLWTPELARQRFLEAGFETKYVGNLGTLQTAIVAQKG